MTQLHELTPPPDAEQQGGHEVLRAFVVEGALSISLQRAFDEPGTWGFLLADIARHVSDVYAKETGKTASEVLQDISRQFAIRADVGETDAIN